jgi:hypothetical protein
MRVCFSKYHSGNNIWGLPICLVDASSPPKSLHCLFRSFESNPDLTHTLEHTPVEDYILDCKLSFGNEGFMHRCDVFSVVCLQV